MIRENNNALEIKNLTKNFSGFTLDHVSFTLPKGSIMGFIGENGAGKTTTLKLILNELKKDEGTVRIYGMDPDVDELACKEMLGLVFDQSYFYEGMCAREISQVMARMFRNWDSDYFTKLIKQFELPEKQSFKEFSRGMKMKLSIATALAHSPKLLLLDEATSGLDPVVRNEILDLFMDFIQDEEHSILLSSHITSDLEKIADYITFIHKGKIVLTESKDVLLSDYGVLKCGAKDFLQLNGAIEQGLVIGYRRNAFGYEALVSDRNSALRKFPGMVLDRVTLEDIMMFYVNRECQSLPEQQ